MMKRSDLMAARFRRPRFFAIAIALGAAAALAASAEAGPGSASAAGAAIASPPLCQDQVRHQGQPLLV